jgi:hypothetical protein
VIAIAIESTPGKGSIVIAGLISAKKEQPELKEQAAFDNE